MPTRTTYLHNSTILQNFCLSVVRIKSCYMTPCSTWNAAARELRGYLFMTIVSVCLCVGDVQARVELLCVLKWKDTQRNGKSCRSNHSMNYCCTVIDIADSIDDTKFFRHIHLAVTNYKKKITFTVELSIYSIFLNSVSHSVNWYSDEQLCYLYRNRFADLVQRCLFFQCFFFVRNTTQQNALEPIFSVEGPHILLSIELEIKWGRSRMNKNNIINKPRWKRRKKKHISKWSIGEWPLHCEVFAMTHEKKVLSKFILIWLKR